MSVVTPTYVSQIANTPDTNLLLYGTLNDKKAMKRFGARDIEEFTCWGWRSCGIVCIEMLLRTYNLIPSTIKTMDLVNEGLKLKGYDIKNDIGWYHKALVKLAKSHGLTAKRVEPLDTQKIIRALKNNWYVMASVKSPSGGHLLLIFDTVSDGKSITGFRYHNPSSYKKDPKNQILPVEEFETISKGRGILLKR